MEMDANWGRENIIKVIKEYNGDALKGYSSSKWKALRKEIVGKSRKNSFYDFDGMRIPLLDSNTEKALEIVFEETILPYVFLGNHFYDAWHDKTRRVFYGLERPDFKVLVEPGDVVIDAGSWIGEFAAYSSRREATVYAFEPTPQIFRLLCETAALNPNINPVNSGLGGEKERLPLFYSEDANDSTGNSFTNSGGRDGFAEIEITTLDDFVTENNIGKVDFIKADIEGFERNMLRGAAYVLSHFAPKLAICTYHLDDDPEVLEEIILHANPNYRVVHKPKILFAFAEKGLK
jgi:FkbM family methyltransferase